MMIYLQKRVIDQNGRSPSSTENSKIRCGMTDHQSAFRRSAIYILACILFTVVSPHCYFAQYPSLFAINFVVQD
ncbi:hypothetical protein [Aeromonas veronii]|uniref:hypothetical protein n=1 Tax=Aeromonas veronii TaxID=654 RepID=UPI003004D7C7